MFCSAGCFPLRAEGFFCSLDVRYGGLGISKLQFLIKNIIFFSAVNFFQVLVIKTLDPDWIRSLILIGIYPKILDPDPDSNESGSETLVILSTYIYG
jgi:hypothetical protein